METGSSRYAVTIANPLGARQELAIGASLENIVTTVRQFSESLLTNRVSKEVHQEVKALVTHLEILVTRRQRIAASNSRSPSVSETRVALRNLKRFLEREAQQERGAKKTSGSCTTDSLESSGSGVQAFSPCTPSGRAERNLPAAVPPAAAAACGSRGDTESCRGNRRKRLQPTAPGLTRDRLHLHCCVSPEPGRQEPRNPPAKSTALRAGQVVRLTSSQPHHFLLLQPPAGRTEPDAFSEVNVHVVTEWAAPMHHPTESRECYLVRWAAATSQSNSMECPPSGCCVLRSRSPVRTERPPLVAANRRLEEAPPPRLQVELAVEKTVKQPVLTAEANGGGRGGGKGGCCICCCDPEEAESSNSDSAVKCPIGRAVVAEQGNFNCASVSSQLAVVSWAKATVADASVDGDSTEVTGRQARSHRQMLSTCSCPSESDAQKDANDDHERGGEKKKSTADSVDIQTSSAALVLHSEPTRLGHCSIQAAPVCLELRVCESCSPEMLLSSTNIVTVGEDPSDWQQPLFRIVDLFRLVRLAAPLGRSGSPATKALEVVGVDDTIDAAVDVDAVAIECAIDIESPCDRSKPTLEVVDQVGTTPEVGAEVLEAGEDMATQPLATPAFPVFPAAAAALEAVVSAHGHTWSSCEVGQSSGFTKLLLTLDKAAKRRREKARRQQRPPRQQPPQRPSKSAGAGTTRSGNNSSRRSRLQQRHPQPASLQPSPSVKPRRQEAALKLAADSLAALSQSLQLCVHRVHEAAEAINCSL